MSWVIRLRPAKDGVRYYTSRGKKVTLEITKAKQFASKEEAEIAMAQGTAWPARKVVPYVEPPRVNDIEILVVKGVEGPSVYLNGRRIAGPKPWGGGTTLYKFVTSKDDVHQAISGGG